MPRKLRILTWHIHGNYLWYLSQARHEFYLPVKSGNHPGYGGRGTTFPFGENVIDVPHDLTDEQREAVEALSQAIDGKNPRDDLLRQAAGES